MQFTREQEQAIMMRPRNLLVSAAAGSGKTAVLVERVLRRLVDDEAPIDVDQILVVTFTEAAADEMKSRIRAALEERVSQRPGDARLRRQLLLLDRADISTLHSFCLRTIRQYFHKLGLDPSFVVLDEHEAALIKADVIDELLEDYYSGIPDDRIGGAGDVASPGEVTGNSAATGSPTRPDPGDFLKLVEWYGGRGGDESLSSLILHLHDFVVSLPDPEEWLEGALRMFDLKAEGDLRDTEWGKAVIREAVFDLEEAVEWVSRAIEQAKRPGGPSPYVGVLTDDLKNLEDLVTVFSSSSWDEIVHKLNDFEFAPLPRRSKGDAFSPDEAQRVRACRDKAKSLIRSLKCSVLSRPSEELRGELKTVVPIMKTIGDLVMEFDRRYRDAKFKRQGLDFPDLERYCLALLRFKTEGDAVRSRYKEVFVDEYQDINPIQNAIIELVSSGEPEKNLFMVGDYRQSIYGFRLAEPGIFLARYRSFPRTLSSGATELVTTLTTNFRSRREILEAVNFIFRRIMLEDVTGMGYGPEEEVRPGRILRTSPAGLPSSADFRVEFHLVERESGERPGSQSEAGDETEEHPAPAGGEDPGEQDYADLEALEKEALVVAAKIREITSPGGLYIWDENKGEHHLCRYRDIVILMRAARNRSETVLGILRSAGIPAYAETETGYFAAREVEIALSLLSVIDNPLQDIPLAAVLRSPIVGLDGEELARIRLTAPDGRFFYAVEKAARTEELGELASKLRCFLQNLDRWRTMARRMPLSDLIWTLLSETRYLDYVGGMPGGAQRRANLLALCDRAREFDSFRRRGLFRFLRFIRRLEESEGDLGQARTLGEQENVVRVLSVHKAKGLEFPVVFVMDLGRRFDFKDLRRDVLFHRKLGLGPLVVDPDAGVKYPTLAYAALSGAIGRESLAEEMRILYVAMTRAREKLFLVGSTRNLAENLERWRETGLTRSGVAAAGTYLDWLAPCVLGNDCRIRDSSSAGSPVESKPSVWKVQCWGAHNCPLPDLSGEQPAFPADAAIDWEKLKRLELPGSPPEPGILGEIERRMRWTYPFLYLTKIAGKTTVGELAERLDPEDEDGWVESLRAPLSWKMRKGSELDDQARPAAVVRGIAVHRLLAHIDLGLEPDGPALSNEIERLVARGILTRDEASLIDGEMVLRFLSSALGRFLRENRGNVKREVPFTLRLPVGHDALPRDSLCGEGDYVVVQGTIDVLVGSHGGLEVIDYKTDSVPAEGTDLLVERYTAQVSWYAFAAEAILKRPVTRARVVFLQAGEERDISFREFLNRAFKTPVSFDAGYPAS